MSLPCLRKYNDLVLSDIIIILLKNYYSEYFSPQNFYYANSSLQRERDDLSLAQNFLIYPATENTRTMVSHKTWVYETYGYILAVLRGEQSKYTDEKMCGWNQQPHSCGLSRSVRSCSCAVSQFCNGYISVKLATLNYLLNYSQNQE